MSKEKDMYQQERMDAIMEILKNNHYVTVDFLVEKIRFSPASIRRDLTLLEKQGLVTRSYGGVTLSDANYAPFKFRRHSMKSVKNAIAKRAAALVESGDVIFLDGSSTTQYMGKYLAEKKNLTVVTCNMPLAEQLSGYGIVTYCTGGVVVEHPGILGGDILAKTLSCFYVDKAFFASNAFSTEGKILVHNERKLSEYKAMRESAKKLVYLCGSDKFNSSSRFTGFTLEEIDCFISDGELPEELKEKHPNTELICVKDE